MEKCRKSAENPKYITHEKNILEKATRVGKNRNTAFCKMGLDNLQKEELEDTGRLRNTLKSKKITQSQEKQKGRTMQNILHKNSGIELSPLTKTAKEDYNLCTRIL